MIWNYEPNVKGTISFLQLLQVKVNNSTVNDTLQSHPDWPSLLSISDSLKKWNIPNAAGRIEKNEIDQLPVPFIAYTHDREYPLAIITDIKDGVVFYKTGKTGSEQTTKRLKTEEFFKIWDGVYLIAEPTSASGEKDFALIKKRQLVKQVIPFVLLAGILLFFILCLTQAIQAAQLNSLAIYLQFALLVTGFIVSCLLLWYEIDKNNAALKKVCTGITKGNCDAILSSKQSKVFSWLSWSEVGFFYFAGSLLNLVFAGNNLPAALDLLNWLSLLALPYTIFSIYYQWRVVKQWCVLCLLVQLLLMLGAANTIFAGIPTTFHLPSFSLLLFLLPALAWYVVKPSLLNLQKAKKEKREHLRLKFNTEIFDTLLKKQKKIANPADDLGIVLGNPAAENEIIKVCNPYCGPCSTTHPAIEKLLEENKNVKARIVFTATNEENDHTAKPVKHLLAIAASNNQELTKAALDDWYLASKKEYELFAAKYPLNGELKLRSEKIEMMNKWCRATDIQFTPTIFINGYQMPDVYSVGDLQYFLSD